MMVMLVPPLGGPEVGEKLVMVWRGHCNPLVRREEPSLHSSTILHLDELPHQPHWKPGVSLLPTQEEHSSETGTQSYRVTIYTEDKESQT